MPIRSPVRTIVGQCCLLLLRKVPFDDCVREGWGFSLVVFSSVQHGRYQMATSEQITNDNYTLLSVTVTVDWSSLMSI